MAAHRIFWGFALAAAVALAVGCAAEPVKSSSSTTERKRAATAAGQHGGYRLPTPSEFRDNPVISIGEAVAEASPEILLPTKAAAGEPVMAEVTEGARGPREDVGLIVVFNRGIQLYAEPLPEGQTFDVEAAQKNPSEPWTDGRKQSFEIVTVEGMKIGVQRGGHQTGDISGDIKVNPAVVWQDGRIYYTMVSDVLSSGELLDVLRTMYGK